MQIQVTAIPEGKAPFEIRRAWLSLRFLCIEKENHYEIPISEALEGLKLAGEEEAFAFWFRLGGPIGIPKKFCTRII